ncbi:PREDICTED: protein SDE2 homolog [Camelina sativa]|uniref:Protein SDE2 homolog n=1 Tax=Camelina sativa TaxID=90675 RepID=A0ABM0TL18_CAMSA|nr:PREDICTED: protein SDE2 homolog [Camelina sativa]
MSADQSSKPLQFFVRLLDGKSLALTFSTPLAYGDQIKQRIFEHTKIPTHLQRLICGGYAISDESSVSQPDATVNLVLPLRGGKGGFGSLLRISKEVKKTSNFGACRDMNGQRLRHVIAEKMLKEWVEGEEDRELVRRGEEYVKEQQNKVKQGVGNGSTTQKYVKKYTEESDKCIQAVDLALKESFLNGKRKGKIFADSHKSKRLKIWKGKSAVDDSDSDDSSDDEDENFVVLNNGVQVGSDEDDTDGSSDLVMTETHVGESSGKSSFNRGSEEENDIVVRQSSDVVKVEITGVTVEKTDDLPVAVADAMGHTEKEEKSSGYAGKNLVGVAGKTSVSSAAVKDQGNDSDIKTGGAAGEPVKPLNFDDFSTATDMEVLGMERLKTELQSRGLKCGGTLQERAARLFLLKSTPLNKLPKKLLAKK